MKDYFPHRFLLSYSSAPMEKVSAISTSSSTSEPPRLSLESATEGSQLPSVTTHRGMLAMLERYIGTIVHCATAVTISLTESVEDHPVPPPRRRKQRRKEGSSAEEVREALRLVVMLPFVCSSAC